MDSGSDQEDSDGELSVGQGRRASSDSLKSINLAASVESVHVTFPEQPVTIRRKRPSSGSQMSQGSSFSSDRSKRGSCPRCPQAATAPELDCFLAGGSGTRKLLGAGDETDIVMGKEQNVLCRQTQVQVLAQGSPSLSRVCPSPSQDKDLRSWGEGESTLPST